MGYRHSHASITPKGPPISKSWYSEDTPATESWGSFRRLMDDAYKPPRAACYAFPSSGIPTTRVFAALSPPSLHADPPCGATPTSLWPLCC